MKSSELETICTKYSVPCISVDFLNDSCNCVKSKQSDNTRYILCTLTENGIARTVRSGEQPKIRMKKPDNTYIYNDCEIITDNEGQQNDGKILIHFTDQMLAVRGNAICDIQLVSGNTSYSSLNFVVHISPLPFDEDTVKSTNEFQTLLQLTINAEQAAERANDAAESANEATDRMEQLEQNVQSCESERKTAETIRQEKEAERVLAEKERVKKEVIRNNNENTRLSSETDRNNAEDTRTANENVRKQNETIRKSAETARINAENARITAETAREENETAREQKIEEFEAYLSDSETTVTQKAAEAQASAAAAAASENNADIYAKKAQSYAIGDTSTRPNESIDNAKYYYEQAKSISENFSGILCPKGTVTFENLPALSNTESGWMYNVSSQFTTTSDFREGAGNVIPAGANIYKTADEKWDVLAGTPVTTVNEQTGNVVIGKEDVGLGNVDNTSDEDKPVSAAQQNELNNRVHKAGDTMSGTLHSTKTTGTHLAGNQGQAIINSKAAAGAYTMLDKLNSTNGYFTDGVYQGKRLLQYTARSTVDAETNGITKSVTLLDEDGNSQFPGTITASAFSGKASSASNADTIGGKSAAYLLNYNNLTNKPQSTQSGVPYSIFGQYLMMIENSVPNNNLYFGVSFDSYHVNTPDQAIISATTGTIERSSGTPVVKPGLYSGDYTDVIFRITKTLAFTSGLSESASKSNVFLLLDNKKTVRIFEPEHAENKNYLIVGTDGLAYVF